MPATEKVMRAALVGAAARIEAAGFGGAFSSDVSARVGDAILVTPAGVSTALLKPAAFALMPLGGEYGAWKGPTKPATEWRIHLDIARARADVGAVVRFHSPYATALAMAHKSIPAAHAMIALFAASEIHCTRYAPAGSKDRAALALEALGAGNAALLGNACALVTGATLEAAIERAFELETLAKLTTIALTLGRPRVLSDEEVFRVVERLKAAGADIEQRVAALAGAAPPRKAKPKRALRGAGKRKRVARKRKA
jgi:L-fuculose-phosphate aldolase